MKIKEVYGMIVLFFLILSSPLLILAEEKEDEVNEFEVPSHVLDISKENTAQHDNANRESVEPSEETKELLDSASIPIENVKLLQQLNESTINPSPIAIGYRGEVYLGRWPLNYQSLETNVNWEYQPINKNEYINSSDTQEEMNYIQEAHQEIKGMLTNKIANADTVREMMLSKVADKTKLPLAYEVAVGRNTQLQNAYPVPKNRTGVLQSYVPAIHEKGEVTFGEVYIKLKGSNKELLVKNVTKQEVGAWIPVQDHVSFSFQLK